MDELIRIIKKYMKSKSTFNPEICAEVGDAKYTPALSKQTNMELYSVKIFLDQVEIERYLTTYLDGIMITQKQCLVRICDQILFFCQEGIFKSSW